MASCRNCGAVNPSRIVTHFADRAGEPKDECSSCNPALPPKEQKLELVPYWEAFPEQYDTLAYDDGERVPIVKDWARGEFEQTVAEGPEAKKEMAEAIERKRAFARERNRYPMTTEQVQKVRDYVRDQMAEVERMMSAEAAGLVLP